MTWLNAADKNWIQNKLAVLNGILARALQRANAGQWQATLTEIDKALDLKGQIIQRMPPVPVGDGFLLFEPLYFDMKWADHMGWTVCKRWSPRDPNYRDWADTQLWMALWTLTNLLRRNRFSPKCKTHLQKMIDTIEEMRRLLAAGGTPSRDDLVRLMRRFSARKLEFFSCLIPEADLSKVYDNLYWLDDFLDLAVDGMIDPRGNPAEDWGAVTPGRIAGAKEAKERLEAYWATIPVG